MSILKARLADMQESATYVSSILENLDVVYKSLGKIQQTLETSWADDGSDTFLPHLQTVAQQVNSLMTNAVNCQSSLQTAINSYAVMEDVNIKDINAIFSEFSLPV